MTMAQDMIDDRYIEDAISRIRDKKKFRDKFPSEGRINIEREVPYLILYRYEKEPRHLAALRLVFAEASYAICDNTDPSFPNIKRLIKALATALSEDYGSFLILEIWVSLDPGSRKFRIYEPKHRGFTVGDELKQDLLYLKKYHLGIEVESQVQEARQPHHVPPLMTAEELKEIGCLLLGLELPGFFRGLESIKAPIMMRDIRHDLTRTLRKMLHHFLNVHTTSDIDDYRMLGRVSVDRPVWYIDRKLAEIEANYDLLLLISPINTKAAWDYFKKNRFKKIPAFRYRLLTVDPEKVKRQLFNLNIQKVDDPSLAFIFRDKRDELDLQMSMLRDRGSKNFLYQSMRLYEGLDASLVKEAEDILRNITLKKGQAKKTERVPAMVLKEMAEKEIDQYRQQYEELAARVEIRNDIPSLMVSKGNLMIPDTLSIPRERVVPLIHHEIGTHVLTYYNGRAQPFMQLANGLAGYDELQEGLAVLSEFLCGGLSAARMRILAGRVLSAKYLLDGADFLENFNRLFRDHNFSSFSAFNIVTRMYQSGGIIKDVIYLRGLIRVLDFLRNGGMLEPLFIGKIAAKHIPVIQELRYRKVLQPPPMTPHFLKGEMARKKLDALKQGMSLTALVNDQQ